MNFEVKWTPGVQSKILGMPDKILYKIARMTLDYSLTSIPKGKTGNLRKTSIQGGVKGSKGKYYIGSYTDYANAVYNMKNANWTTPGTGSEWYKKTWDKNQGSIIQNAVKEVAKQNGFK